MPKNKHIAAFVNDLFDLEPDLILDQIQTLDNRATQFKIAADSPVAMTLSASRIGSLTDGQNRMLVRVYKDKDSQYFRMYLLSSTNQSSAYVLLSVPGQPNIFVADSDGQIEIPFSTGIDPLNTIFHLNFPLQVSEIDRFPEDDHQYEIGEFKYSLDRSASQLRVELVQSKSVLEASPTKLIVLSKAEHNAFVRLIPLRDFLAILHLDDSSDFTTGIALCTYS